LQVIYLHGRISREESKLIFSPTEYAREIGDDWLALNYFGRDQLNGKILYVGSKLNEPDFDFYMQKRIGKEYDGPINESILVSPDISDIDATYFSKYKVHCVKCDGKTFFEELDRKTSNRTPPQRLIGAKSDQQMNAIEKESFQSFRSAFSVLPEELDSTFLREGFDFFEGGQLSLQDLEANFDCRLSQTEDALKIASEWVGSTTTKSKIILLHGGSGCGKSSSLRRVAYEISKDLKFIFWHNGLAWPQGTNNIPRLLSGKVAIVVDDVHNFDFQLKGLVEKIIDAGKSVLVLIATRDRYQQRVAVNMMSILQDSDKDFHEVECNWLNKSDTARLAKHLIEKERLGPKLRGKSEGEIQEYFYEHSSKILIAAMLDAFSSTGHSLIIKDEYEQLSDFGKKIYLYTAVTHSRGEPLGLYILSRATGLSALKIWAHVNQRGEGEEKHELRSVVRPYSLKQNDQNLVTRHSVIAEVLVSEVDPLEILQVVKDLCKAIAPFTSRDSNIERDTMYRIGKMLIDQKWLTDELGIPTNKVEDLFVSLEEKWSWNYHYWIQRATFELHKTRNFKKAWDYCKAAIERESRSGIAHITYANICFHWAKSEEKFGSEPQALVEDAQKTLRDLHQQDHRDPVMHLVAIKGLFHIAARFKKFAEYEGQIRWWIDELKASGSLSRKINNFIQVSEQILKGASLKEGLDLQVKLDELDFFDPFSLSHRKPQL